MCAPNLRREARKLRQRLSELLMLGRFYTVASGDYCGVHVGGCILRDHYGVLDVENIQGQRIWFPWCQRRILRRHLRYALAREANLVAADQPPSDVPPIAEADTASQEVAVEKPKRRRKKTQAEG